MSVIWLVVLAFAGSSIASPRTKRQSDRGPLYDYVHRQDGYYKWTHFDTIQQTGFTTYYLNMTSQRWYDETFTDHPIWWHYLIVHIPDTIAYPQAGMLYISGSGNDGGVPGVNDEHIQKMGEFAVATGVVAAALKYIPNQPVMFENDGWNRVEDQLIAWTWKRFYEEQLAGIDNPEVLARMPMCKASSRAMDAIQEFVLDRTSNSITGFMIAGESKRGWTTWLTGAVDERVKAMAPVVLSCVNMIEVIHHYYRSLGGWSFALGDYWLQGLMGLIDSPEMAAMAEIIDPYYYIDYMQMPKLMISGASDEFFMFDDYSYFYDDLLGEKYIWIAENSDHDVSGGPLSVDYWEMLQTFYLGVLENYPVPQMSWIKTVTGTGGSIQMTATGGIPTYVKAWSAPSVRTYRRDWRMYELNYTAINLEPTNIEWVESSVQDLGNGIYRAQFDNPSEGYLAFFMKVKFDGPKGRVYSFTTEAVVIPDTWPYDDCSGTSCQGILV